MYSVVVVTHKNTSVLRQCLERLFAHHPDAEVIVVDTGFVGEQAAAEFPKTRIIRTENRGYAYAVNRGLEVASRGWVVVINDDVLLEATDLAVLRQALMNEPKAAFAGPTLVTPQGRLQGFGPLYHLNYLALRKPRRVAWISGALMLMPRNVIDVLGGMDERYFFYNEDTEWCLRARRKGYCVLLVSRRVLHLGGASTPDDPRLIAEGYRGGLRLSRDYYPPLHGLHRKVVWLEAWLRARFDRNQTRRQGHRLILDMLKKEDLEATRFF